MGFKEMNKAYKVSAKIMETLIKTFLYLSNMRCPQCGSDKVILDTGGQTSKYRCSKCGYFGPLIIEENDMDK